MNTVAQRIYLFISLFNLFNLLTFCKGLDLLMAKTLLHFQNHFGFIMLLCPFYELSSLFRMIRQVGFEKVFNVSTVIVLYFSSFFLFKGTIS